MRFSQAIATAGAEHATFIEISPHPLLTHAITDTLGSVRPGGNVEVAATVNRDSDETLVFYTQLATVRPPSGEMPPSAGSAGRLADIPPTPWLHARYWFANRSVGRQVTDAHPLLGLHVEMPSGRGHLWQTDAGTEVIPWMADYKVHGRPVMPAAGFAEIALAAGSEALGVPVQAVEVTLLEVEQMLALESQTGVTTQLVRSADNGIRVEVYSRSAGGSWCRHAVAHVESAQPNVPAERTDSPAGAGIVVAPAVFMPPCGAPVPIMGRRLLHCLGSFECPTALRRPRLSFPTMLLWHRGYRIHPVMLMWRCRAWLSRCRLNRSPNRLKSPIFRCRWRRSGCSGDVGLTRPMPRRAGETRRRRWRRAGPGHRDG